MALPLQVATGHSNPARIAFLLIAVVSAALIVLDTEWGRSVYPGVGMMHDHLKAEQIKAYHWPWIIGIPALWQLSWPPAVWTADQGGITRVINGFFGTRRTHFPLSSIVSMTVRDASFLGTDWFWLHIKLASGQKIRFRVGQSEDAANALLSDLEEAGARNT